MPPPGQPSSLREIAGKIARDGPYKHEPAKRRIRGLLGGKWIFDTLEAEHVWEHPYYPVFYIPLNAIESGDGEISIRNDKPWKEGLFEIATLTIPGGQPIEIALIHDGDLNGLVRIPFESVDTWFAEDTPLAPSHPKDPYQRIECLTSSRRVRIELDGAVLAESTNNIFLYETGLRVRYYLPLEFPLEEVGSVKGRLCFYNEKVDVFVEGVREE